MYKETSSSSIFLFRKANNFKYLSLWAFIICVYIIYIIRFVCVVSTSKMNNNIDASLFRSSFVTKINNYNLFSHILVAYINSCKKYNNILVYDFYYHHNSIVIKLIIFSLFRLRLGSIKMYGIKNRAKISKFRSLKQFILY